MRSSCGYVRLARRLGQPNRLRDGPWNASRVGPERHSFDRPKYEIVCYNVSLNNTQRIAWKNNPRCDLEGMHHFMTAPSTTSMSRVLDGGNCLGPGVATCGSVEGLAALCRPGTELVIWHRALALPLRHWVEQSKISVLPDLRVLLRPQDLQPALLSLLDTSGTWPDEVRALLIADIANLVAEFSCVAQTDLVDVRLEGINHDACWKFHRDRVEARLLTTYGGPATQWVQPRHAAQALREQKQYQGPIEQLQDNAVAIFKGTCAGRDRGIVHRSPPVAATDETRLLLCLNKPLATSPSPWPGGRATPHSLA